MGQFILLFVALVALYMMITSRRRWLNTTGIVLSLGLTIWLSIQLGFHIGQRLHSCEPPPIEVYL